MPCMKTLEKPRSSIPLEYFTEIGDAVDKLTSEKEKKSATLIGLFGLLRSLFIASSLEVLEKGNPQVRFCEEVVVSLLLLSFQLDQEYGTSNPFPAK